MARDEEAQADAVSLAEHVDSILTEKDRALKMADDEREKAASALRSQQERAAITLATSVERSIDQQAQHFNAILTEKDRALEMADDEREKAASALRGQQERAEDRATAEREKAATALAASLERSIREGDERLREHIANQVAQINRDLGSADKLELERIGRTADMVHSLGIRLDTVQDAAAKAIEKAEVAAEKRFECVAAETPILCADLVWRPAGQLVVGDQLIALDEKALKRRGRMFRQATVTDNSLAEDALLLVTTPQGSVRCNRNHPWLVRRLRSSGTLGTWEWIEAKELRVGDSVLHSMTPWDVDNSWDAGWLAGIYDGEGCLSLNKNGGVQLSASQRQSPTADRVAVAIEQRLQKPVGAYRVEPGKFRRRQPAMHYIVSARADVMQVLGTVRPPRLMTRAREIWDGKPIGGKHRDTTVSSIEEAGVGVIARLSTTTHTYIAGGFAMHNSVNEFRKTLSDQTAGFMTRAEVEARFGAIVDKVDGNQTRIARLETNSVARSEISSENRSSQQWSTGMIVTIVFAVAALAVALAGIIVRIATGH